MIKFITIFPIASFLFVLLAASTSGATARAGNIPVRPVSRPAPPSAAANTDSRGFINIQALRRDVIKVLNAPPGEQDCSPSEGDGEADEPPRFKTQKERLAYERQRRKEEAEAQRYTEICERENQRAQEKHDSAVAHLNQTWLPLLQSATRLGDPVAEVVLRLCETVPLLDRTGIAADCSESEKDRAHARTRLEAIAFKPALHQYTITNDSDFFREKAKACTNKSPAEQTECEYRLAIERYQRILSVMRTGYVSVAEMHAAGPVHGATPALDKLAQQSQRLMLLMMGVAGRVNKFYTAGMISGGSDKVPPGIAGLTLARPLLRGAPGVPWITFPFDERGVVTRTDHSAFSDPQFQEKFYAELDRIAQEIEANIAADLRREPRWAVFVIERLNRKLYDATGTGNASRPAAAEVAHAEAASPRSQAIRREQEIARLKTVSYQDLIRSLHTSNNRELHYVWDQFPLNLQEINRRPADFSALVAAYRAEKQDDIFRFNIIMILNRKWTPDLAAGEKKLIEQCLVDALSDASGLVRAEASWKWDALGDRINDPVVKSLVNKGRQEEQDALRKEMDR